MEPPDCGKTEPLPYLPDCSVHQAAFTAASGRGRAFHLPEDSGMQDGTPAEMLTDKNHDNDEELLDQDIEVEEEEDDDEDFDEDDLAESGESSEGQPQKNYDPTRQLQNLTQISHES